MSRVASILSLLGQEAAQGRAGTLNAFAAAPGIIQRGGAQQSENTQRAFELGQRLIASINSQRDRQRADALRFGFASLRNSLNRREDRKEREKARDFSASEGALDRASREKNASERASGAGHAGRGRGGVAGAPATAMLQVLEGAHENMKLVLRDGTLSNEDTVQSLREFENQALRTIRTIRTNSGVPLTKDEENQLLAFAVSADVDPDQALAAAREGVQPAAPAPAPVASALPESEPLTRGSFLLDPTNRAGPLGFLSRPGGDLQPNLFEPPSIQTRQPDGLRPLDDPTISGITGPAPIPSIRELFGLPSRDTLAKPFLGALEHVPPPPTGSFLDPVNPLRDVDVAGFAEMLRVAEQARQARLLERRRLGP